MFCCSITESTDFSSTQLPLIFDSAELQQRQCVQIPIEDDQIYENQETFLVTLDSSNPDVIITLGNSTDVLWLFKEWIIRVDYRF